MTPVPLACRRPVLTGRRRTAVERSHPSTHLSSRTLSHRLAGASGALFFGRSRAEDMTHIPDRLDEIENAVPGLAGRINHGFSQASSPLNSMSARVST